MPVIDLYFKTNYKEDMNVNDILNHFLPISLQLITEKIGSIRDSYEVTKYIDQFALVISQHIRRLFEKHQHDHDEKQIFEKEKENQQIYKEQMSQKSAQNIENHKTIIKKLFIDQVKIGFLKEFVIAKEKQIQILNGKLQDLPYYQNTYNNKNEIADEISNSIT